MKKIDLTQEQVDVLRQAGVNKWLDIVHARIVPGDSGSLAWVVDIWNLETMDAVPTLMKRIGCTWVTACLN